MEKDIINAADWFTNLQKIKYEKRKEEIIIKSYSWLFRYNPVIMLRELVINYYQYINNINLYEKYTREEKFNIVSISTKKKLINKFIRIQFIIRNYNDDISFFLFLPFYQNIYPCIMNKRIERQKLESSYRKVLLSFRTYVGKTVPRNAAGSTLSFYYYAPVENSFDVMLVIHSTWTYSIAPITIFTL